MASLCRLVLAVIIASLSTAACGKPAPKSIDALRSEVRDVSLELLGEIEGGPGFSAELYAYDSAGLRVHAMVARPLESAPDGGWPVLIANHGHHPDPPRYGITAEGKDHRPGDYYRSVPALFVARGFLVVMPDFRGHNNSEGLQFTEGMLESAYYSEDVLNLLSGLDDISNVDIERVFMWGHSMGGEVTLRTLVATDRIRAASIWSSVGGDIWDQSYYYSRYIDPLAEDSSEKKKKTIEELREDIASLKGEFDWRGSEPLLHLESLTTPIAIHHSIGDRGAAYKWSELLAKELYILGHPYRFYSYEGDAHFFDKRDREIAADRDAQFFRSLMND